ncbi:hypothetical protein PSP20601_04925 [Pandoraea sputorum]|nr:hypothetical protein PSP20601_04925 [Pandoraea sputorum]
MPVSYALVVVSPGQRFASGCAATTKPEKTVFPRQSRRPLSRLTRKVSDADRATMLRLRAERKGARRIQSELRLYEQRERSLATIHKVLCEASVKPLGRPRRPARPKRYRRAVRADRVQRDTRKSARGVYPSTAIDDCSRFRVLAVYARRNAVNTLLFLDLVIEEVLFPLPRIQTDRGGEFFAESVQRRLISEGIKFRSIPPRSPRLNGKVARSQLTDLNEYGAQHVPGGAGSRFTNRGVAVRRPLPSATRLTRRKDAC